MDGLPAMLLWTPLLRAGCVHRSFSQTLVVACDTIIALRGVFPVSEIAGGKVTWLFIAQAPGFVLERAGWNSSEKAEEGAGGGGAWAGAAP